jgi:hypothetical protein
MHPEDNQAKPGAGLSLITERFPEEGNAWRRLFEKSLSCQSLWDDYQKCLAERQNWQQATSEAVPVWPEAYTQLRLELEQEVGHYLEHEAACSTGPR